MSFNLNAGVILNKIKYNSVVETTNWRDMKSTFALNEDNEV